MSDTKRWYVVHVADSKRISYVPDAVRTISGDSAVWIPMKQVFYRIRGKLREVAKPLFPNYVFIHTDADIDKLEGVVSSMSGGHFLRGPGANDASIIDDEKISEIRGLVDANSRPQSIAERYDLEVSQHVEILNGPFTGCKGYITALKKEMVIVDTTFFGRNMPVEVNPAWCRVVSEE